MSTEQHPLPTDPHDNSAKKNRENRSDQQCSAKYPWWLYGCQVIFFCLLMFHNFFNNNAKIDGFYLYLAIMVVCIGVMFVQFIRAFIKQHAQYSIKSLLILTFCVAVLCSIYVCFGFELVFWIILLICVILSQWVRNNNGRCQRQASGTKASSKDELLEEEGQRPQETE